MKHTKFPDAFKWRKWQFIGGLVLCLQIQQVCAQVNPQRMVDSLLMILDTARHPLSKVKHTNKLAFRYLELDPTKAQIYARQALDLAQQYQLDNEAALAYNTSACAYIYLSQLDSALTAFLKALELNEKTNNAKGKADVLGNMGSLFYSKGEFGTALEYMFRALKEFENLKNMPGEANTVASIGNLYMEQGDYGKAEHYDSIAMLRYLELKDQDGEAMVLGNLANIYSETNRLDEAKKAYEKSISLYESIGSISGVSRNLMNLAQLYHDQRDYIRSEALSWRAYELYKQLQYQSGVAASLGNIGVSCAASAKYFGQPDSVISLIPGSIKELRKKAVQYLRQAVEASDEASELSTLSIFSEQLYQVYSELGDYEKALFYYKKFDSARDSLFSTESKLQIEKLTTQREIDLKNKQIELDKLAVEKKRNERLYFVIGLVLLMFLLLFIYRNFINQRNANLLLEDKNVRLSDAMRELREAQEQLIEIEKQKEKALLREKISQDIHDDISTNLTKISLLSERLKLKTDKSGATKDDELIEKISHFSRESVTKLSDIIWSINPERDNLQSLLSYVRVFLNKFLEDAPLEYQIDFPEELPEVSIHPE
ncbi:MAG: tetratricopeptide repeat protein, partial [Saprospiraceae bacterium]